MLSNPNPSVIASLERANLTNKIGREFIFVRVADAITYIQLRQHAKLANGDGAVPPAWSARPGSAASYVAEGKEYDLPMPPASSGWVKLGDGVEQRASTSADQ